MKLDMNYRIMEKLRLMRHNNVLCDLEVQSRDGIKHRVHSCVWAAAFEDCRTLLSNKYKGCLNENNKIIHLSTIDAEVLSTIVDFIYGEEISSIPVGLDGGLKQLGFQGFRYYLNNTLSDSVCNETNLAQSSPVSNDKLRDLHTLTDVNCNSGHIVQDHVKKEIVQENVHNSLLSQGESTKNDTNSVEVKLEPVESISEEIGEENDDQMSNIKIYSKPGDDDQTVTVCVEYNCSVDNEDTGECVEKNQETQLPVLSTSQEKDKESTLNEKSHKEQREDITCIKNNTSADAPQNIQSVVKDPKQVPVILSSPTTVNTSLDSSSGQFMKNPPILPKFPSTQGDVVTVATFLSFAELQKQGKTWKLQENLVPIPMSRNSTDAFNKLPIFPQCSQSKSAGEKRSRGRPKALDTGKAKVSNEIQRNAPNVGTVSCTTEAVKSVNSKGTKNRISPSLSKYDQKEVVPVTSSITSICNDYTCSTATRTTSIPMQVPIVEKSISMRNCDRITNQKRKPVTTCTNVVDCAKPVTSVVPTNFPLPLNFSSITKPVRICQQQGGSRIFHTMIPCFDFNDAINAGSVPPSANKINPHILLNPRPTMDKSIPQGSLTQQVSMQTLGGTSIYSVPTSNPYICINSEPVFPLTSNSVTSTPKPRIINSRSNQKAKTKQNSKSKSLSAPVLQKTSSPVSAERNHIPTYREIKPKLSVKTLTPNTSDEVSKEVKSDDSDRVSDLLTTNQQLQEPETTSSQKQKNLLRNPRKRTRSLQSNKTLLNEPVDKYIYDNIKKTRRTISSSLKIKMKSVTPQLRFLKNRKQKDMVAELFRNSVGGEIHRSAETSGSPIKKNEKKD